MRSLGDISWTTVLVGLLAGADPRPALLRAAGAGRPRTVVAGLLATWLFDLGCHGVALVGPVPRGLPAPTLPSLDVFQHHYTTILAAAAGLLLIGFSQTVPATPARLPSATATARRQPEVSRAGWPTPLPACSGDAGLDEPLGEFAPTRPPEREARWRPRDRRFVILTLIALAPLFSQLPKAVLAASSSTRSSLG